MLHVYTFESLRSGCWDAAEAQAYLELVWRSAWELPCDLELLEFSLTALEWGPAPDDLICVAEAVAYEPELLRFDIGYGYLVFLIEIATS